jgi:hypothetical protein
LGPVIRIVINNLKASMERNSLWTKIGLQSSKDQPCKYLASLLFSNRSFSPFGAAIFSYVSVGACNQNAALQPCCRPPRWDQRGRIDAANHWTSCGLIQSYIGIGEVEKREAAHEEK